MNSSPWSLLNSFATRWLKYSEPLSLGKPWMVKGEVLDEVLQDREEESFADALDGADKLELGDCVDGVDEVEALDAVQVVLVHEVDSRPAGAAAGTGLAPLANGVGSGRGSCPGRCAGVDSRCSCAGCRRG